MRRGPRLHNSRVESERRGNGALMISAPYSILATRGSAPCLLERIRECFRIVCAVSVQALKILLDGDRKRVAPGESGFIRGGPLQSSLPWHLDSQRPVSIDCRRS